ncbi:MAG: XrtA system polysaccharide chain length determinant [Steroidobacteraceae bacterium]
MNAPSLHNTVEDLLDQLRGLWRFRWIALAVAWCAAVILWIIVFTIPNTYESYAKVFVDTRTTLSEATEGLSLGSDIGSQIERVRDALLGGPELRTVANETGLMAGALTGVQQQAVIANLRKNIDITGNLEPHSTMALFTITYRDPSRARSLKVVDRLLNTFVEGTLGGKQQGSEQAEKFLTGQIGEYGQRLSASEQRLAAFKKQNVGLLPGEQGDYFSHLQADMDQLTKDKESLGLEQRKRAALAQELHTGQQFTTGPSGSGVQDPAALDTEGQIAAAQQKLNQLLLKFTNKYPDVIALRQTLKQLRAREKAQIGAAKRGDLGAAAQLSLTANPVYQKLQEQYNGEDVTIASIQQEIADRENEIASLRSMISTAPEVQAQYAELTRDYKVTRTQYDALLARLDRAKLGQKAASTGDVKFQIIDPPTSDFAPVAPRRGLLVLGALIASFAAGAGVAYLLHLLRPVFVSARQLGAVTGLPVLGSVSMAWLDQRRAVLRSERMRYVLGVAVLVVLGFGILVLQSHISGLIGRLHA